MYIGVYTYLHIRIRVYCGCLRYNSLPSLSTCFFMPSSTAWGEDDDGGGGGFGGGDGSVLILTVLLDVCCGLLVLWSNILTTAYYILSRIHRHKHTHTHIEIRSDINTHYRLLQWWGSKERKVRHFASEGGEKEEGGDGSWNPPPQYLDLFFILFLLKHCNSFLACCLFFWQCLHLFSHLPVTFFLSL